MKSRRPYRIREIDTRSTMAKPTTVVPRVGPGLEYHRGHPTPLGASARHGGVNFALFSSRATAVTLRLFAPGDPEVLAEQPLDPTVHRTGNVWHVGVIGIDASFEYAWRVDGPSEPLPIDRFDPAVQLVDPYALAISGAETWRGGAGAHPAPDEIGGAARARGDTAPSRVRARRSVIVEEEFDWGDEHRPDTHLADSVIFELHVRGFTRHASSAVEHPGTFAGIVEKIPYLKELGVTAVELMPVTEFEELDNPNVNPTTGERLVNYWGYDPINFFALKSSYASKPRGTGPVREFKTMVKALHDAGIEVILDVVFNHTAEKDEDGPTFSFRGLDNAVYYLVDPRTGEYVDYSGCGNTVNCNHPVVRDMILDALRYWVTEMHVDGFRFDLASILGRGRDGKVLSDPPLLERIAADPVLAGIKLIAEAWDAAGLYQVGSFPSWGRWAEWNGRFRDDVRRLVRGEPGMIPALATRLAGSSDLYEDDGRAPYHSVNFVTSHDGFTLLDLVSYDRPHNETNGQDGLDGSPENFSWNCGAEGPSSSETIRELRRRQMKNLATLTLLSQGVPMILAGDELGRTQNGNNNAYCHDDETSWIDWSLLEANRDLLRFFRMLIAFRRRHPALRRRTFFENGNGEVHWHGTRLEQPDWSEQSRSLGMHIVSKDDGAEDIYLIVNAHWQPHRFELPAPSRDGRWHLFVDTAAESPYDIRDEEDRHSVGGLTTYEAAPRSVVVLLGRRG